MCRSAKRSLYPRFSLTGSAGTASTELTDLVSGDFSVWNLAGNLLQPIFQGGRLRANAETSGRYHSAWLSMMWPRLHLARSLLRDDGVGLELLRLLDVPADHHLVLVAWTENQRTCRHERRTATFIRHIAQLSQQQFVSEPALKYQKRFKKYGPSLLQEVEAVYRVGIELDQHHIGHRPLDQLERVLAAVGDDLELRAVTALGLHDRNGVIRVSMVHYNTPAEVTRLVAALDRTLP